MSKRKDTFPKQVYDREKRKLNARKEGKKIWFGLGMFGVIGWSIALPTVAGGFLGIWIDSHWPSRYSWTLMFILGGLGFGCFTAWNWIQKERQELSGKEKQEEEGNG
jgi:ATP synthase protein I